jgi:hypothetical protein
VGGVRCRVHPRRLSTWSDVEALEVGGMVVEVMASPEDQGEEGTKVTRSPPAKNPTTATREGSWRFASPEMA